MLSIVNTKGKMWGGKRKLFVVMDKFMALKVIMLSHVYIYLNTHQAV